MYTARASAPARGGFGPADMLTGEFEGRALSIYVVRDAYPLIAKTAVREEAAAE